jgi:hypothetical protein
MAARQAIGYLRPLALGSLGGGLLVIVAGLSLVTATDPFVAGQPGIRRLTTADAGRAAVAQARRIVAGLGLPATATAAATRLEDRVESATYDEVTFSDVAGRPVLVLRVRPDGTLRDLSRLDAPSRATRPIERATAAARASAVARSAGLRSVGDPVIAEDPTSAWAAAWPRNEGGAPVLGDGTWVRLDTDGSVRSVASVHSSLAPRPADVMTEAEARRVAERQLDGLLDPALRSDVRIADARLAWVAPNDTFAPARPDAPGTVKRLAWVVRAVTTGQLAERLRGFELDLDAGDGRLLGGDTLE